MIRDFWPCIGDNEFLCPYCGAVVNDFAQHGDWHHELNLLLIEMGGSGRNRDQ